MMKYEVQVLTKDGENIGNTSKQSWNEVEVMIEVKDTIRLLQKGESIVIKRI